MLGASGMPVEQVEAAAHRLRGLSDQVEACRLRLDGLVARTEEAWRGPDAEVFRDDWAASQRLMFQTVQRELSEAAANALREAADQRRASAAG